MSDNYLLASIRSGNPKMVALIISKKVYTAEQFLDVITYCFNNERVSEEIKSQIKDEFLSGASWQDENGDTGMHINVRKNRTAQSTE